MSRFCEFELRKGREAEYALYFIVLASQEMLRIPHSYKEMRSVKHEGWKPTKLFYGPSSLHINFDFLEPDFYIVRKGLTGEYIIFLFKHKL